MRASERMLKNWDHPRFDLSTDSRLVFAPDGALIGYAHVCDFKDPPVNVFAGYSVHPSHSDAEWLWNDLFSRMEKEARRVILKAPEDARIALVAGTSEQDGTKRRELERHGFEHDRTFRRMMTAFDERAAPAVLPEGIAIRAFGPSADGIELVTAHREAFSDHYGILRQPFETDFEEWRHLMQEDDFDAPLWCLAYAIEDGAIVGFCACYGAAPGDPERGLTNDVGIRQAWRRHGIG